jgi:hypothetical protein
LNKGNFEFPSLDEPERFIDKVQVLIEEFIDLRINDNYIEELFKFN